MCGRFYVDRDYSPEIAKMIVKAEERLEKLSYPLQADIGEIIPNGYSVVLANNRKKIPTEFIMSFGYMSDFLDKPIINARFETSANKPIFKESFEKRHCVIPVSCFYEWKNENGKKIKYQYKTEKSVIYLCGIYILYEKVPTPSFIILTQEATKILSTIHNRMPVVVSENNVQDWIQSENYAFDFSKDSEKDLIYCEKVEE